MSYVAPSIGGQRQRRRGAAAVEFAILAPLLVVLLLGLWEVARLVEVQQILTSAAREGGRWAAAGSPQDQVVQVVRTYLLNEGIPDTTAQNAVVTYDDTWETAGQQNAYRITVSVPFKDVRWVPLSQAINLNTTLTAAAVWPRD